MFYLQLNSINNITDLITDLKDQNSGSSYHLIISNETLESVLHKFTKICERYTVLMATKHQLQHYMFNNPNETLIMQLAPVVSNLEITTFILQHIQVSMHFYTSVNVYIIYL